MPRTKRKADEKRRAKTGRVTGRVKYLTRSHLIECSDLGVGWGYNRQVSERVAELHEADYPVTFAMPHHHRGGVPCEAHVRCVVEGPNRLFLTVDMPVEYYRHLPVARRRLPAALARRVRPLA
jgi:hypothetical protein